MDNLITAGELAKLASTTKRTIHFYDEKGVLKPVKVNSANYRYYLESQILDFQRILLLSTLGVSLDEMKKYLRKNGDLAKLFDDKKELIEKEIRLLEFNLQSLTKFQANLKANGTMVNPVIKVMAPFSIYFIEKEGAYAKIGQYCEELSKMFENMNSDFTTLAIFEEQGYRPKKSKIKNFDADLVEDFLQAIVSRSGITMHVTAPYGRNIHHIIEAVFRAIARKKNRDRHFYSVLHEGKAQTHNECINIRNVISSVRDGCIL